MTLVYISVSIISPCQVLMANATINNLVNIRAVNVIATT